MKKLVCLCLALLTVFALASCGEPASGDDTTAPASALPEVTDTQPPETIPFDLVEKRDYGGYVFNILYPDTDHCERDFEAESVNGEVQNDAVYERNTAVENRLNVKLALTVVDTADIVIEHVNKQFASGDNSFDMFGGHRSLLALSYQGKLYDLRKLEALDFDGAWWDGNYNDTMTINGSLYSAVGDLSVASMLFVSSLTFNKRLMDESNIAYPYDKVRNGEWTYQELLETVKDYGSDTDGDGTMKLEKDVYSIVGWSYESGFSCFYSSGFSLMTRSAEGKYEVDFDSDRLTDLLEKANALWHTQYAVCYNASGDAEHEKLYKVFADGRALFSDICLSKIGRFYTNMADDYGILPFPKFTADQDRYYSYCGYTIPVTLAPRNIEDPERTGTVIEALAKASYTMVTPKIFEIVTKSRNVRDADSPEMVEIVYRNKFYDVAHFYNLPQLGSLSRDLIISNNTGMSAKIKSGRTQGAKEWDKIQQAYDALSAG